MCLAVLAAAHDSSGVPQPAALRGTVVLYIKLNLGGGGGHSGDFADTQ